jgi:FtsP/CotA-like multicopper oxidase with cupredoxin domain
VSSTINGKQYNKMFTYETSLVDGQGIRTRGNASAYIAPEWQLNPGDRLIIDYFNDLPPYAFTGVEGLSETLPQPLNLHTHGLTVSPAGNGDNVLLSIPPKSSNRYTIDIPKNHHHGLYWYHPHIHGLSDDQVYEGLAGHIVIGRADGNYKEFDGLDVVPMLLRYNVEEPDKDGNLIDASATDVHGTALVRDNGRMIYTTNGLVAPAIRLNASDPSRKLAPESQVWAFTNVTGSASYILALEEIEASKARDVDAQGRPLDFVIVSVDGSPMPAPVILTGEKARGGYHLPQGGRVAILVQGPSSPSMAVRMIQVQNRSGSGERSAYNWEEKKYIGGWRDYSRDVLAVTYTDDTVSASHVEVPASLTPNAHVAVQSMADEVVDYRRTFIFNDVAPPTPETPNDFPINFGLFPDNRLDQPHVGTVEEWTILNYSSLTHPFHFHTQYGQVMEIVAPKNSDVDPNYTPAGGTPYPTLQYVTDLAELSPASFTQDVAPLPPALIGQDGMPVMEADGITPVSPGKLVMRLKFLDYLGTYVEHCHRLPHEDRGMMTLVRSIPNDPVIAIAAAGTRDGAATVNIVSTREPSRIVSLTPFEDFTGNLATAVGDVDGDTLPDVAVASGSGRPTAIRVYSGASSYKQVLFEFTPFGAATSGASVALGDLNGDHKDDILVGEGLGGASRVVIYDGVSGKALSEFQPYERDFTGGVNVATGMVEEGGRISFFTAAGPGRRPQVRMYNVNLFGNAEGEFPPVHEHLEPLPVATFDAADANYLGGLSITTGYPFAAKGGFANVITSTLRGPAQVTVHTMGLEGHHDHGSAVSPTGVHRAVPYFAGAPRHAHRVASLDLSVSQPAFASGAVVGMVSTKTGAVLVAVPSGGGTATRWTVNSENDGFENPEPLGVSGNFVSGM